jgi:hypothetical protein
VALGLPTFIGEVRFLEHRIGDKRIIRLIQKWLRAGILEQVVKYAEALTETGRSPLVFLLYQKGRDSRIFQAQDRAIR